MPIAESKRKGNDKYNSKCDYISLRPLRPVGEQIRAAAKRSGKSLQGYILEAVQKQMEAENALISSGDGPEDGPPEDMEQ